MQGVFKLYCFTEAGSDPHGLILDVDASDLKAFQTLPNGPSDASATVTNLVDGRRYSVRREDCGAACYCAARATQVG